MANYSLKVNRKGKKKIYMQNYVNKRNSIKAKLKTTKVGK